ncbi:DEDD exonuclease domain-containing protein [Sediminivirga luteola]|nr:DEDD exonuclease domain-containing protein [Sediminivirga luteola]MCI2264033.1 DEDD exonuclease domain-containing protein [Sediminivirga luteola]
MKDQERFLRTLVPGQPGPEQLSFADLGQPLSETTFMAVDLETTGTGAGAEITEIGAVKVRGGEVLGEFQSLVRPAESVITPYVSALTGITNSMVLSAPELPAVLPSFLEFAAGTVWVAHNAPFDIGFLKRACQAHDYRWPRPVVLDTVKIARATLSREEIRNHKLATLAAFFQVAAPPDHRALTDARATVDVLHGLIARLGSQGVFSLEELRGVGRSVSPRQRSRHHLAADLPSGPGVYLFLDAQQRPLYIGTSVNIRSRVKQYFTAAETRSRMGEMVQIAQEVRAVECASALEANVRELRLIAQHKPPYNRRSRTPERAVWLRLTDEDFPRLSVTASGPCPPGTAIGPFGSRRGAMEAKRALEQLTPVRSCTRRLRAGTAAEPCPAGQTGHCGGPCQGITDPQAYAATLDALEALLHGSSRPVWDRATERMAALAAAERFEEAARLRDGALRAAEAARRAVEHGGLERIELVAAAPSAQGGGWEIAVIRHGRLAAAARAATRREVPAAAEAALLTAEHVAPPEPGRPAALPAETALISRWLSESGARLLRISGEWSQPVASAPAARHTPADVGLAT